ncbi:MAG: osmoprotectant NAGGN system M42 family peptidase [Gammaproteobacteria bacterium]|nr:osmoprotectant NAGGN system M42 family peptidase [Gammaproteobacteria bacterium]
MNIHDAHRQIPTTKARPLDIDADYLCNTLLRLLKTPSPSGYTDRVVHLVCHELQTLGIPYELTRRGAIRATLAGHVSSPDRAVVAHVDTLGAMVKALKPNGRLELVPIGHWSARFAEGARVLLFTDTTSYRGTILPLKASGHTFNEEVDTQPVGWPHVELRIDEPVASVEDLMRLDVHVGDFIAVDANPEFLENGYIVSRHLDDKAGAAVLLTTAKALVESGVSLPTDLHLLFTITEEVGSGASAVLHGDVAEMVSIDNGTTAPGQNSSEYGVTVSMADTTGPFDYHLTHHLLQLCREYGIAHQRDVFRYYRSDSAAAVEAGNDIRTALLTFGIDASHGYERIHIDALTSLADLLVIYAQNRPVANRDRYDLGPIDGMPLQHS